MEILLDTIMLTLVVVRIKVCQMPQPNNMFKEFKLLDQEDQVKTLIKAYN